MAIDRVQRFYSPADFTALQGELNLPLLVAQVMALPLEVPIQDIRGLANGGVIVDWGHLSPSEADRTAVDGIVSAYVGGQTTKQPIEVNSFAVATAPDGTPVSKIDVTTLPLDAGTYQVMWTCVIRMQAVIANTGVEAKIVLTRSDGVSVQQTTAWDLNVNHAYNGGITFLVNAGQTIQAQLSFMRLGASGVAEMSGARITIDQLSAA